MTDTVAHGALDDSVKLRDFASPRPAGLGPPALAILIAGFGAALLAVGALTHDIPGINGFRSAVSFLFPVRRIGTYAALPYVAVPALALAGIVAALRVRLRPVVAGLLFGIGIESYGLAFPYLAYLMAVQPGGKALLWAISAVGAAIVLTGSALLYARAEDTRLALRRQVSGLPLPLVVMSLASAMALYLAVVVPSQPTQAGWQSLLGASGAPRWFALEPFLLASIGLAAVAGSAGRARAVIGGVLAGLGLTGTISFGSMVIWTGALGVGSAHVGSYLGLAGALGFLVAGLLAAASARAAKAVTARQEPGVGSPAETSAAASRESTRLLSATAQLDPRFARRVVRDVVKDDYRAVAPSFGVSLGSVLRQCIAARGRHLARNVLLVALTPLLVLGLAHLRTSSGAVLVLIVFVVAWAANLTASWTARHRVATRCLTHHNYDPGRATRYLTAGADQRIRELEEAESTNVVVYSGYSPFVGSGFNQTRWSFAVNVERGREEPHGTRCRPRAFAVDELEASVGSHLDRLGMDLRIFDRLYVDGELVRDEPRIVPDRFHRPRTRIDPDELAQLADEGVGRRFSSVTISGWAGELVYTLFLSFSRTGASLFADATCCLLLPPQEDHRRVDSIEPRPFIAERLRAAAGAALATVRLPLDSWAARGEAAPVWRAWRRRVGGRRAIATNPRYDYGAVAGVREVAQSNRYRRYFQFADRDMYGKILDREIFAAVTEFLAQHDVDTSDLEERQAAVLNYGVMVTGGRLDAESLAVGAKAQSTVSGGLHRLAGKATGSAPTGGS